MLEKEKQIEYNQRGSLIVQLEKCIFKKVGKVIQKKSSIYSVNYYSLPVFETPIWIHTRVCMKIYEKKGDIMFALNKVQSKKGRRKVQKSNICNIILKTEWEEFLLWLSWNEPD